MLYLKLGDVYLLRNMKNNLNKSLPLNPLKELSMGMSNDYEIAIEEGATQIRLGTVLFGPRNQPKGF